MRHEEREILRRRFDFRCGYCGVRERDVGAELTVDHFQPQSRGGAEQPDNWIYCCHACNEFKGDCWQPESDQRILHPLLDDPLTHFAADIDGVLRPRTETGRFHIERLRLNRPPLVQYRRERQRLERARMEQAKLLFDLNRLEADLQAILDELSRLRD